MPDHPLSYTAAQRPGQFFEVPYGYVRRTNGQDKACPTSGAYALVGAAEPHPASLSLRAFYEHGNQRVKA